MRVTSKGQITIPQDIREKLKLLPHTEVGFEIDGDAVKVFRLADAKESRGRRLVKQLRGTATSGMTTDEIMSLTRDE